MTTVVIKLHSWHWHSPNFIRRLQEHTKDLEPSMLIGRPAPEMKEGVVANQNDLDKWDNGWRRFEHGSMVEIPIEVLSYYLPCEVDAIHHSIPLNQMQQRTDAPLNARAQVITPGHALQDYDQVYVEVDCCTDRLQDLLNEGWRLLAICVQPDQRRPDYVLGRRAAEGASIPALSPDKPRPLATPPTIAPTPVPVKDDYFPF